MTDEEKKLKEDELENAPVDDPLDPSTDDSSADTDTGTDDDKSDTDTGTAISDEQKAFDEAGLSGQFGSAAEALRRIPDFNRHTDQLHKRNLTLEQDIAELKKTKPEPPDPVAIRDKFDENPLDAFEQAGLARKEDVDSLQSEIQKLQDRDNARNFADSLSEYPELKNVVSAYRIGRNPVTGTNRHWDKILELLNASPGLETAGPEAIVKVLLPQAKKLIDAGQKPPVEKVSDADKAGANSPSPGKTAKTTTPDYSNMTSDQVEADMRKRGLVDY